MATATRPQTGAAVRMAALTIVALLTVGAAWQVFAADAIEPPLQGPPTSARLATAGAALEEVISGDNSIIGEKITVDRKKDRMTVESGEGSRVNAVIFTGQDGVTAPAPSDDAARDKSQ